MKIVTKFNHGDDVFLLYKGKIIKDKIREISIIVRKKDVEIKTGINIYYSLYTLTYEIKEDDDLLFSTPEELSDYLLENITK